MKKIILSFITMLAFTHANAEISYSISVGNKGASKTYYASQFPEISVELACLDQFQELMENIHNNKHRYSDLVKAMDAQTGEDKTYWGIPNANLFYEMNGDQIVAKSITMRFNIFDHSIKGVQVGDIMSLGGIMRSRGSYTGFKSEAKFAEGQSCTTVLNSVIDGFAKKVRDYSDIDQVIQMEKNAEALQKRLMNN